MTTNRHWAAIATATAVALLVITGCGNPSPDPSEPEPSSSGASPASAEPEPSSSGASPASAEPSLPPLDASHPLGDLQVPYWPYRDPGYEYTFDVNHLPEDISNEALGSGCVPGSDSGLPDGEWFGYLTNWGVDSVDFDLACAYWGGATTNSNSTIRTLAVAEEAQFLVPETGYSAAFSWARIVAAKDAYPPPQTSNAVWIYINDGTITQIAASDIDEAAFRGSPYDLWGAQVDPTIDPDDRYAPVPTYVVHTYESYWSIDTPESNAAQGPSDGVFGSGCNPGDGNALPDGAWYGLVVEVDDDQLVVDLECWWAPGSPKYEAELDECEASLRNSDEGSCYINAIENTSARLRTNPLAPEGQLLDPDGAYVFSNLFGLEAEFWPADFHDSAHSLAGYWIYVNEGEVTAIAANLWF